MKGYMYILECSDGSFYTGSTKDLELRLQQHNNGEGANHTRKRLPVRLVYYEEFNRIDEAFYREKQVQGWSRKKKEALMEGAFDRLRHLARNYTEYAPSTSSGAAKSTSSGAAKSTSSGAAIPTKHPARSLSLPKGATNKNNTQP